MLATWEPNTKLFYFSYFQNNSLNNLWGFVKTKFSSNNLNYTVISRFNGLQMTLKLIYESSIFSASIHKR